MKIVQFMDLDLIAAPDVLVPREETELLGRTALEVLGGLPPGTAPRVIDMCCGSGNLACAIAAAIPAIRGWASDLTDGAVAAARANIARHGLTARVDVLQGDLFAPLTGLDLEQTIDLIVCNPPYISSGRLDRTGARLLAEEPRAAFDGGPFGIDILRRVIREAPAFLKTGGTLLVEVGEGQAPMVAQLFHRTGSYGPATTVSDRQGRARVVAAMNQVVR